MSYGADNFYRSNDLHLLPVVFNTQFQTTVAGNLFTRKDIDRNITSPAIIVGHPHGAVKEQSADLYAQKMAEQGFVTVSIDLPFWGGSSGEPRNGVSPEMYAEAFSAAVDHLGTQVSPQGCFLPVIATFRAYNSLSSQCFYPEASKTLTITLKTAIIDTEFSSLSSTASASELLVSVEVAPSQSAPLRLIRGLGP
ncbi:hypothetical protein O1611_g9373 [Lasiodiplodia mahajangana]|uniref:Uncharacterized protein n=1 Tax=Lasiodiplodia mahajangana TaxID=1108764 RepID=A0ACC2J9U7_9PEZI|nr:hypothetical protein O1611_g9373 [Lasiodiplodia mahajangana]